tara:strand:+ start:1774 stop:2106 length:333 start_codon:yes stop_codon:yes gene_type:complete
MWGRAQRASYCGASGFVKDIAEHVIDDIGHRLSCGVTVDRAQPLIPFYRSQNLGCPGIIHFLQITPIGLNHDLSIREVLIGRPNAPSLGWGDAAGWPGGQGEIHPAVLQH